jgi:para-aminobenzoate synthetase component 1
LIKRTKTVFDVTHLPQIKEQMYTWSAQMHPVAWYDSNEYPHQANTYDALLAAGISPQTEMLHSKKALRENVGTDWLFGFFAYEYDGGWESVSPSNTSHLSVPELQFFSPEKLWLLKNNTLTALYACDDNAEDDFAMMQLSVESVVTKPLSINLNSTTTKDNYLKRGAALQQHILRGDIYEVNYCMEWYAKQVDVNPKSLFSSLNAVAKTPFSAYLNINNVHLVCASPERFLSRTDAQVVSQPIKGTAARHHDKVLDDSVAQQLKNDSKERSENIMITDLVRNDLSRVAQKGSVRVSEQCAVYPFAQVHQMISSVVANCAREVHSLDVINACFPMGSMTGAPKQRAMELIDRYENSQRGLYSGAVGYFAPNGDFDFNVVIRSLIYNSDTQYLSVHVGSALTAAADMEKEYEECQLKVEAIKNVLANKQTLPKHHGTKV